MSIFESSIQGEVWEGTPLIGIAQIYAPSGAFLDQVNVDAGDAIVVRVWDEDSETPQVPIREVAVPATNAENPGTTGVTGIPIVTTDANTSAYWGLDGDGFNFFHIIPTLPTTTFVGSNVGLTTWTSSWTEATRTLANDDTPTSDITYTFVEGDVLRMYSGLGVIFGAYPIESATASTIVLKDGQSLSRAGTNLSAVDVRFSIERDDITSPLITKGGHRYRVEWEIWLDDAEPLTANYMKEFSPAIIVGRYLARPRWGSEEPAQ